MTKTEIITASAAVFNQVTETCEALNERSFFSRKEGKWSAAENLQHLIISTNMTTLAYALPRFLVRWSAGKPNRPGRTFTEVKDKYYNKLREGGRASARFVPRPLEIKDGKQRLLENWKRSTARYLNALGKKRTEADLDNYLAKHPLLGRMTLRELCYFTVFHTEHHLQTIKTAANP